MSRPLPAPPKTARGALEMRAPMDCPSGGMAVRDPYRPGSALHRQDNAGRGAGSDGTSFMVVGKATAVGLGGFGWGFAPGCAIGFGTSFYGGVLWRPVLRLRGRLRRRWVINRWGHHVLRWTRVRYEMPPLAISGRPPARRPAASRVSLRASHDK